MSYLFLIHISLDPCRIFYCILTVLRVTVPDQYFCTKHPDLNITARENKNQAGTRVPAYGEIFTSGLQRWYNFLPKLCNVYVVFAYCSLWTVAIVGKNDSGKEGLRKQWDDVDGHSVEAVISSQNKKRGRDGLNLLSNGLARLRNKCFNHPPA